MLFVFQEVFTQYNRGLTFHSFEVDQDNRTGLNLTPDKMLKIPYGFTLSFDIKLKMQEQNFGYVFRIVDNNLHNIDLVSDVSSNEYLFSLISGNKSVLKVRKEDIKEFRTNKWIKISLTYNSQIGSIEICVDNLKKHIQLKSNIFEQCSIFLGANKHSTFSITDVPSMSIRDIKITNGKNELIRYWKLEKHSNDVVYDETYNEKALTYNPIWEIDNHVKWERKAHISLGCDYPQIAYDSVMNRLFIVSGKHIVIYDNYSGKIDSFFVAFGAAYRNKPNQLVYDTKRQKLISYSFDNDNLVEYNKRTNSWTSDEHSWISAKYWHHSKFYDYKDSSLITIGGYGHHKYKGDLMRYSLKDRKWKRRNISSVMQHRYLGAMGYLGNDQLLYFGGYGSKTGNQEEFPKNYYDLYVINNKTLSVTKLWEMDNPTEHFVNGNSLIVDKSNKLFYSLVYSNTRYSTSLKLLEFHIDKPVFKEVGDSISYKFNDVESYCDLYYSPKTSELIAVTVLSKNNGSEVNIFSIAYPPLQPDDVLQKSEYSKFPKWYLLLFLLFVILVLVFFSYKRRIKPDTNNIVNSDLKVKFALAMPDVELKSSSINFLGCFQVIDRDGKNITGSFSPMITQIFLLITLYSIKNSQGISSQELTDILWYDRDPESIRNNRNVNISRLRLLLKNVGDVEIINSNSYWQIHLGRDVFCDYKYVMYLTESIIKQKQITEDIINEFIDFAYRGALLPNLQEGWLDNYKGVYTNTIIETLSKITHQENVKNDYALLLRISETMLLQDNIDDDAARLRVYALYNLGKKGLAKQYYEKFLDDYKNFMNADYKMNFDEFRLVDL